jgi:hypothetical protein
MSRDPDDPNNPPRPRTRTKSITLGMSNPNDPSPPSGPRTRTRAISIGALRGSEKSRTKTKELPPIVREKTKLVIELDDPGELIGFLEQIIHVLRDNKSKKITLVIEE